MVLGFLVDVAGNHPKLGNQDINQAIPMQYLNQEYWQITITFQLNEIPKEGITYHYILKNEDGTIDYDWGND
ncbi:CBM20 domain-containing protein, partial [Streptomyces sp. UMAF16]|nr:CBM20 domain-containing protein [Streptomyces sp. UMAF16]